MTTVDWIAAAVIGLAALNGLRRGLVGSAFSLAGIAAGGTAIEDPPGVRSGSGMNLYLAYLRDPSGNKICAMHRLPADA